MVALKVATVDPAGACCNLLYQVEILTVASAARDASDQGHGK